MKPTTYIHTFKITRYTLVWGTSRLSVEHQGSHFVYIMSKVRSVLGTKMVMDGFNVLNAWRKNYLST